MADKKSPGIIDMISDWWNAKPQAAVPYEINGVPQRNQTANRQTLQRYAPAPYLSKEEALANILKNAHPLDFTRDLLKGGYSAIKSGVTDPVGSLASLSKMGSIIDGIYAARQAEQTGKWENPEKGSVYSLMKPSQLANWRREATANYRKLASHYSYIKDGERYFDSAALARNLTQHPMDVMSVLFPAGEVVGAKLAASSLKPVSLAGKALEMTSKVGNIATNPAPYVISKTVKVAAPVVEAGLRKAGVKPTIFTKTGEYSQKMQQAFKDAGVNPDLFNDPKMRDIVQAIVDKKGISPAAIKDIVLESQGIRSTRSMTTGEKPMAGSVDTEKGIRQEARGSLAQSMQNNVEAAYNQATSHRGTFTNTADFSSGVRQSVENELSAMGLSLADVQGNVRFAEAQKALQGAKGFPGVFDQFDELAGVQKAAAAPPPKPLTVDFGGKHTFDYDKGHWVDPNGVPVTKPNVINALDGISDRKNIPVPATPAAPTQGPNRLTPQNIDSVRRNVNSRFSKAEGDDAAVLAAINRGIDNYTVQNAANFTGDGAAMASDWANARKTSQLAQQQYGNVPAADPFAAPKPPVAYDPNALGRTEAARGIVQAPAELPNTAPPTIWEHIRRFVPSTGAGNIGGYTLGAATGLPGAGLVGGAIGGATTGAIRERLESAAAQRAMQTELAGAPRTPLFTVPDMRIPTSVAGGIATAAESNYQTPVTAAPAPRPTPAVPQTPKLPEVVSPEEYEKSIQPQPQANAPVLPEVVSPEEYEASLQPQPQARGGRAAYKAGGKVGGIEHLVQALMSKAKTAKKVSNKATEPLLNERDDAIANALAVAQKAI